MAGIETTTKRRVKMFYLDTAEDIAAYEKILNNPKLTIVNRESAKVKESEETIDEEAHIIHKKSKDRIIYIIDYSEDVVEG